ncbi:MAG: DUF1501 domain-containing protein [Verrucomicrobia bacterium]|nr:DUF1501 domain-containing protein [Verrucomicrobiota bacterium]
MRVTGSFNATMHSRRHFLWQSASGLGGVALAWLLHDEARAQEKRSVVNGSPYSAKPTHFPAKAKRVIHIFAAGGVSHVDTFDHKPELTKHHGQPLNAKTKYDPFFGQPGNLLKSPWQFRQRGRSGAWVSDLLPNIAACADDITFIKSMVSKSNNHTPATFLANSGFTMNGYPSLGAWLSYGLGSVSEDLPAFVVLPDTRGLPAGGAINWSAGFLPATHQGVAFRTTSSEPIVDLNTPADVSPAARDAGMKLLAKMNREFASAHPGDTALAARMRSYELAARMQASVPEAIHFDSESEATKKLYGLDVEASAGFGRNCLLARRLLERGVRFVQLFNGGAFGSPRINWDAHEDLMENHTKQALVMDRPVAGLLQDLKARGMLDDTLLIWSTEFGRTPVTQGVNGKGRDHHQLAFTCWMAGAGLKPGFSYGASDEIGYDVGENPVTTYDFHATILHLLGLDHTKLTYYHNGIQRRLTDVHGQVVKGILV